MTTRAESTYSRPLSWQEPSCCPPVAHPPHPSWAWSQHCSGLRFCGFVFSGIVRYSLQTVGGELCPGCCLWRGSFAAREQSTGTCCRVVIPLLKNTCCFPVLVSVRDSCRSFYRKVFMWTEVSIFQGEMPASAILAYTVIAYLGFFFFFQKWLYHFSSPPATSKGLSFSTSVPPFGIVTGFHVDILMAMW